ncbi:hypothetical protein HYE67_006343 [Fusarium culmorum]|uniref:Uncharacterized protein n=1 Tax=Fusarium culmorum TaxID=5516 RepID=A0A2T4H289_FUSCU|nr:hypothetical protein FCULG_00007287 [Fusarium culmorum]QPC64112.1 hypothetical protein HYE67_006343 [Fusarium culmorum]
MTVFQQDAKPNDKQITAIPVSSSSVCYRHEGRRSPLSTTGPVCIETVPTDGHSNRWIKWQDKTDRQHKLDMTEVATQAESVPVPVLELSLYFLHHSPLDLINYKAQLSPSHANVSPFLYSRHTYLRLKYCRLG